MVRFGLVIFYVGIVFVLLNGSLSHVAAQVRSSTNYQIESDSLNVGGGLSASENYFQESTVGEVATGNSDSETYNLYAGYQQMQEVFLSLSAAADVIMSPGIGGLTGGQSNGSTSVVALTDARAGYQLTLEADASPAMQSPAGVIADYVPAGVQADTLFVTDPTDAHFGFSIFGNDTASRYLVSGGVCGSGTASTTACWDGLSTAPTVIAQRQSANQPDGSTTTIYFKVGIGGSVNQAPGNYVATTTLTMLPL